MKVKYKRIDFNPENLSSNNIDRQAIEQIPEGAFVLDVGCATGFMGDYLIKNKKCKVWGVELDQKEAAIAKKFLDKVYVGSIEDERFINDLKNKLGRKKFDVLLSTSTIEHTVNPDKVLKNMLSLLKSTGILVLTTPNIAHWSMRLSLLKGDFEYTDYGIMDATHLRFFTIKSFKNLFIRNKTRIVKIGIDAEGGGLPRISIFLSKFFPGIFAYQILIVAKKLNHG